MEDLKTYKVAFVPTMHSKITVKAKDRYKAEAIALKTLEDRARQREALSFRLYSIVEVEEENQS